MATAMQKFTGDVNRTKVVQMRSAGKTLEQIAGELSITEAGVRYHLTTWLTSQKPSSEQTEELRQLQLVQIDSLAAKLEPWLLEPELALPATDRLVKLMDRKARLMGLDLQQNVSVNVLPTAEQLASLFGWDATAVIEGTAVEEVVDG